MDLEELQNMSLDKRKEIKEIITTELNSTVTEIDFDPTQFVGTLNETKPSVNVDYMAKLEDFKNHTKMSIHNLAIEYLNEFDELNSELTKRIIEDHTQHIAIYDLLVWNSKRLLFDICLQIDNGDNHPRMFDIAKDLSKELRESMKMRATEYNEIRKYYINKREELSRKHPNALIKQDESDLSKSTTTTLDSIIDAINRSKELPVDYSLENLPETYEGNSNK